MLRILSVVLLSVVVSGCVSQSSQLGEQDVGQTIAYAAVFRDYAALAEKYHTSARTGNPSAQYNLGYLYKNVAKDYSEAYVWYTKSATQGYAKAQNNLAVLYADGDGVEKDYKKAYMWFNIAFANGYERAVQGKYKLQSRMSEDDKLTAQRMALACVSSRYKNCL